MNNTATITYEQYVALKFFVLRAEGQFFLCEHKDGKIVVAGKLRNEEHANLVDEARKRDFSRCKDWRAQLCRDAAPVPDGAKPHSEEDAK